jgi:hypothetical protein
MAERQHGSARDSLVQADRVDITGLERASLPPPLPP